MDTHEHKTIIQISISKIYLSKVIEKPTQSLENKPQGWKNKPQGF
jgi:hypothetical protein